MKPLLSLLAAALLSGGPAVAAAHGGGDELWLNPRGTVAVRMGPCGAKLCGWIVWASTVAKADAKDSGIEHIVGTELLEDYVPDGPENWAGNVYVPDMGHRFPSTITRLGPNEMKVQGCLIGRLFCRSQVWRRIEKLPDA